jgi:CDP-diacylglycerol---serine O-phosphatidyltransferase
VTWPRRPDDAPRELLVLKLLPNLVSILALCSGLTAIRYGIAGNFTLAVLLIGSRRRWTGWTVGWRGC